MKRIGFACKYMHPNQNQSKKVLEDLQRPLNTKTTTVAWMNRQKVDIAEQRLWDTIVHNIKYVENLVNYVGSLPDGLRMVRLGSDILPFYTEPTWSRYYQDETVTRYCAREFARVGDLARDLDVRLSFHPGQFVVLASDNPDIVDRSIAEFEYHVDMARWMGFGKKFQDFKINVHIAGKRGPAGIKDALRRLSPEARNTITIENDENRWGIEHSLELVDDCALVLDIHHHLCREGEYIYPSDDRYLRVIDSWRGVRPVIHYSYSREEYVGHIDKDTLPDFPALIAQGYKKAKLRAHSDWYPNNAANRWALSFLDTADIMCESKCKNLASIKLYEEYTNGRC